MRLERCISSAVCSVEKRRKLPPLRRSSLADGISGRDDKGRDVENDRQKQRPNCNHCTRCQRDGLGLFLVEGFFQVTGKNGSENLEVGGDHIEMASGDGFDFEVRCQIRPDGDWVAGKIGVAGALYKFYFPVVNSRPIVIQSNVSFFFNFPGGLREGSVSNTNGGTAESSATQSTFKPVHEV